MAMKEKNLKTFRKGEVIFREGEFQLCMYDIINGRVGIYAHYGEADQKQLAVLENYECFGEMGLVESKARSATAVALEKTQLHVIDAEYFDEYFKNQPSKVMKIMQHMSLRTRELTRDYMEACQTISEYLEAEQAGEEKSQGLIARMKRFAAQVPR